MKNLFFPALLIAFCCLFACQKNDVQEPATSEEEAEQYLAPLEDVTSRSWGGCSPITIPAGSVDALQQAIDDICMHGVIYLEAGMHTENAPVSINKAVKIIGEEGAVLKIESAPPAPWDANFYLPVHPAIHVKNAFRTLIQDLEIEPLTPDGNTAILVESSKSSAVMRCKISNFQHGVLTVESDGLKIMHNTIATSGAALAGDVEEAFGIFIVSGKSVFISHNELSNAFFGAWVTDKWGTFRNNYMHGNFGGILLCNAPPYVLLPSGDVVGSPQPATGWKVRNNKSQDNLDAGFLVIDGADRNFLQNNQGGNNGTYDIDLVGESDRFGYTTPTSLNNKVIVGSYHDNTIKDCGLNNKIYGTAIIIDNSVDPCF